MPINNQTHKQAHEHYCMDCKTNYICMTGCINSHRNVPFYNVTKATCKKCLQKLQRTITNKIKGV